MNGKVGLVIRWVPSYTHSFGNEQTMQRPGRYLTKRQRRNLYQPRAQPWVPSQTNWPRAEGPSYTAKPSMHLLPFDELRSLTSHDIRSSIPRENLMSNYTKGAFDVQSHVYTSETCAQCISPRSS